MRNNKLINFRNVIYSLSRDFGFRIAIYRPTKQTNYRTGVQVTTRIKYHIRRAIILPNEIFRDFAYAAILSQLNVQPGGLFDSSQRRIIIGKRELPLGFMIEPENDYVIFNHDRYDIGKSVEMELADYWIVDIKQVKGQPTYEVHEGFMRDKLDFLETIDQ